MTSQAVSFTRLILTRLIAVRLLWYAGIGAVAFMALALHTQFSVAVVLSAIAIYIPLSMLSLPLVAWLSWNRARLARTEEPLLAPQPPAGLPSAWPAGVAAVLGMGLLASHHVLANLDLAESGTLLLLVAGDLWLARREAVEIFRLASARRS